MQAEGEFTPSPFVQEITGVDNVCERAAALLSGGRVVLPKELRHALDLREKMKLSIRFCAKTFTH